MTTIRCKACGKGYSYHKSDLCPRCGAYNRPSSRLRVDFDADGNAELLSEKEFLRQSEAGKNREKVCYERKECHEDQVRVSEKPKGDWMESLLEGFGTDQMEDTLKKVKSWSGSLFKAKAGKNEQAALVVIAVVLMLLSLLHSCVR